MRCSVMVICLLTVTMAGCGRGSGKSNADSERAREVLIIALDAWKSNQLQSLASQSPPIRLLDDDCVAGCQLIQYELPKPGFSILPFHDVQVVLELADPQGRKLRKPVTYQVGLVPIVTVQRSDN